MANERDIRADEDLGDVDEARVRHQAVPERIVPSQLVAELIGAQLGVAIEQPIDMAARVGNQRRVEDVPEDHESGLGIFAPDVVWRAVHVLPNRWVFA